MEMVTAYHGTTADPEQIRNEGLKVPDFVTLADAVFAEYAHRKIPKWVYKTRERELRYREAQGSRVHLTLSRSQAWAYSGANGGEFVSLMHWYIRQGLGRKHQAKPAVRYVVKVTIPMNARIKQVREACKEHKLDWEDMKRTGGWDIIVDSVPPESVLSIEEVTGAPER